MRIALLLLVIGATAAAPGTRIVGGHLTTIENYPDMVATLVSWNFITFSQGCGGSIINQRSILTAAHCFDEINAISRWRSRVGSSFASAGGVVHSTERIIIHPNYHAPTFDNDVAIIHTSSFIVYNNAVRAGSIAGTNYNTGDNAVVWAAGWGATETGHASEQLRHVQIWTINQSRCRQAWNFLTDRMLCIGWIDVGGRDQCVGDSGGPVYHNGVIVGVCSFGSVVCGSPTHPGVNARVSSFTNWIVSNART